MHLFYLYCGKLTSVDGPLLLFFSPEISQHHSKIVLKMHLDDLYSYVFSDKTVFLMLYTTATFKKEDHKTTWLDANIFYMDERGIIKKFLALKLSG